MYEARRICTTAVAVWNYLPDNIRTSANIDIFNGKLKQIYLTLHSPRSAGRLVSMNSNLLHTVWFANLGFLFETPRFGFEKL